MRNKIFVILCSFLFLALFVGAPLFPFLTNKGILPYQNVGNQITAEKVYEEDHPLYSFLTAIEEGKVAVKDTYINYLPGFLGITNYFKPLKSSIDRPLLDYLAAKGRELISANCRHSYTEQLVPPSCTEDGYTRLVCRLCNDEAKTHGHIHRVDEHVHQEGAVQREEVGRFQPAPDGVR